MGGSGDVLRLGASSLAIVGLVVACASGPPLLLGQPIKKEVAVLVHASAAATHGDQFGGIGAVAETVSDGLTERGVRNQIYAADDDHPGTPRIEIMINRWGIGDVVARALVGWWAPGGEYDVVVKYYREGDTAPTCVRDFNGGVNGTDYEASADAGHSVGKSILAQALSPKCDVDMKKQPLPPR